MYYCLCYLVVLHNCPPTLHSPNCLSTDPRSSQSRRGNPLLPWERSSHLYVTANYPTKFCAFSYLRFPFTCPDMVVNHRPFQEILSWCLEITAIISVVTSEFNHSSTHANGFWQNNASEGWYIPTYLVWCLFTSLAAILFFSFQVNDFLAGKSPLTLAMRLGDHMMFVQLQLSTSQSSSKRTTSSSSSSKHRSAKHAGGVSSSASSSSSSLPSRHQAPTAYQQQQQQHQQTVPSYVSPPQVSPSSSISSPSSVGTGSKVVVPVPVHAQPRTTSHPYAACYPNSSKPSLQMPAAAGAAPQTSSGLKAPNPSSGVIAPKPTKMDGVPVLDSSALAEASRNLSQKLKELSAASSTHIKTPVDVKQKKVISIASIVFSYTK